MNVIDPRQRSIGAPPRFFAAHATSTCRVPNDVVRGGRRRPERMNRFATAAATMATRRASVTYETATIGAVVARAVDALVVFSHPRFVPKRTVSEKVKRDMGILAAIRKHRELWTPTLAKSHTPDTLAAVFEAHLQALERVSALTTERAIAIADERRLEARIATLARAVKSRLASYFGADAAEMAEFGFRPDKTPTMSAETKRRANEKRQATRKERGVMGRKQRKKAHAG